MLRDGSVGAQQVAAAAICRISSSPEMKRLVGDHGCMPVLVRLLEAKSNGAREVAAQATATLMSCPANARDVKKDEKLCEMDVVDAKKLLEKLERGKLLNLFSRK
ncbi:hypothetical protein ACQ4PT_065718 [Festuca glaucescens]